MKLKRFGWTLKDERLRKFYSPFEFKRKTLKFLLSTHSSKIKFKFYFLNCFYKISKKSSLGRYRRYCLITYSSKLFFNVLNFLDMLLIYGCFGLFMWFTEILILNET